MPEDRFGYAKEKGRELNTIFKRNKVRIMLPLVKVEV